MGLLLPHKSKITIHRDMLSVSPEVEHNPAGGGKRDEIKVFSQESRYRLFKLLHTLQFDKITFCTLTYPREFPDDVRVSKRHLKEYRRRFESLYGPIPAVWRLEFQKRGAPHYHLLYLDCPYIRVSEWSGLWADVVSSSSVNHRKSGVDVKLITGKSEAALIASYVAKYVGKVDDQATKNAPQKPGRWWGRWNIPEEVPVEVELYPDEVERLVAHMLGERKKNGFVPSNFQMCTVFGETQGTDLFQREVIHWLSRTIPAGRVSTRRRREKSTCENLEKVVNLVCSTKPNERQGFLGGIK